MSDIQLELKVNRIVGQSGFKKSDALITPIMKVLQMRYKDLDKNQALKIVKSVLN
ncbi:MAG: hypothetical protein U9Q33_05465 [Campylobacterota bacterium]|nr:hypothetical protein [Campylobacterota bacterium]